MESYQNQPLFAQLDQSIQDAIAARQEAERKAQEAAAQAKADEESRKETEKIRQVFEQKDAVDKYDNSKISQKAMSVKTGDKANAGGMLAVVGVAGMIAALAQKIKRREQD